MKKVNKNCELISIVMPVYNAADFIQKAIDSVVCQSYEFIELIIVNDGSTDNSLEIIKKAKNRYKFIKIINQENQGAGDARNSGINAAKGKYLMFLDQDDSLDRKACQIALEFTRNKVFDFVCFGANFYSAKSIFESRFKYKNSFYSGNEVLNNYLSDNKIKSVVWNKFYNRDFINRFNLRFSKNNGAEDSFFIFKLSLVAKKIGFCSAILYNHSNINPESFTNKMGKSVFIDLVEVLNEKEKLLKNLNKLSDVKTDFYIHAVKHFTYLIFKEASRSRNYNYFCECVMVVKSSRLWNLILKDISKLPFYIRLRLFLSNFPFLIFMCKSFFK
jgi:glycosyltransferase involved in cell wall biosynthesis